ncbi:GDP-L-fucose synthase [Trebonia kvetii]|uniref:GDP-L-fucose synthase n=1 Tax=Trebonia kvetii TaxID=2480626 RepID=A0A6P2C6T1_9ACTN|nr:GDP-L-fucose synthase [Trebonia kvetii]TVZ07114.1 GDP-L-fucose synthase [Trebonia kvetii]
MRQREEIPRDSLIYVAGHQGLVGSAIWRRLSDAGCERLVGFSSRDVDLRERSAVDQLFREIKPDIVIDAAARVGGILANASEPADFLEDNLRIQVNVLSAAQRFGVQRLLFLGSSCIYPKFAAQPIREDSLMTGALEPTNDAYAVAKIAGIMQVQALRRQYGVRYISAMPTNLYGPGDNFSPTKSHVLPALIRRIHEAKNTNAETVTIWGTGTPRREFLFVDDLADALVFLLEHYDSPEPINVGVGIDVTIRELAETIADVVGWNGNLVFDETKPDGTPRKLLDVSRLNELGWRASTSIQVGIKLTYDWFLSNQSKMRGK